MPPSSGSKSKLRKEPTNRMLFGGFWHNLPFDPKNGGGGITFLLIIGRHGITFQKKLFFLLCLISETYYWRLLRMDIKLFFLEKDEPERIKLMLAFRLSVTIYIQI
jgi:hypothetical protein